MNSRFLRKRFKILSRAIRRRLIFFTGLAAVCLCVISYTVYIDNKRFSVNAATYQPLLNVIARAESNGNYNAYYGNSANSSVDFTEMSIADVQKWQADYVEQGAASSAVGRYQIIDSTLHGLVKQLEIDTTDKFDETMQDRMAIALLERRGAEDYVNNELKPDEFAAELAKEWAGLPKVVGDKPEQSYYAGDGLNKSRVSIDEVLSAIEPIQAVR